jgi:hypothetical protein
MELERRHKFFAKKVLSLAKQSNLNCKLQYNSKLSRTVFFLDFWKKNHPYRTFKYYIVYNIGKYYFSQRNFGSPPRIKTLAESFKESEILRFLGPFIKQNYRKF